jgi:hypothetical protein
MHEPIDRSHPHYRSDRTDREPIGVTLGYRVLYAYFPASGAIIVVGLNRQPDDKQNQNGLLLEKIYGILHAASEI